MPCGGCTPEQIRESLGVPLRSTAATQTSSSSYQLTLQQVNQAMGALLQGTPSLRLPVLNAPAPAGAEAGKLRLGGRLKRNNRGNSLGQTL
jgi:hypothetical protein